MLTYVSCNSFALKTHKLTFNYSCSKELNIYVIQPSLRLRVNYVKNRLVSIMSRLTFEKFKLMTHSSSENVSLPQNVEKTVESKKFSPIVLSGFRTDRNFFRLIRCDCEPIHVTNGNILSYYTIFHVFESHVRNTNLLFANSRHRTVRKPISITLCHSYCDKEVNWKWERRTDPNNVHFSIGKKIGMQ